MSCAGFWARKSCGGSHAERAGSALGRNRSLWAASATRGAAGPTVLRGQPRTGAPGGTTFKGGLLSIRGGGLSIWGGGLSIGGGRSSRKGGGLSIEGGGLSCGGKSPSAGLERPSAGLYRAGRDCSGPSAGPPRGLQGPTGRFPLASPFLRPLTELAASPSSLQIKSGGSPAGKDADGPRGATPKGQSCLDRALGIDSKAGTLVHEMSHFNVTAGTSDYAYGTSACQRLASSNPKKAINNADSHEYFAETR